MRKNFYISLIVVIMFSIIITAIVISINKSNEINFRNNLYKDIEILENKISIYYIKNKTLPIISRKVEFKENKLNPNDNEIYYEIDLEKLDNIKLTYGYKRLGENDYYIINEQSHTIYYYNGINWQNRKMYTREIEYTYINLEEYQ